MLTYWNHLRIDFQDLLTVALTSSGTITMKEKKKFLSWQELQPLNGTQLYHDKQ
jgi:hypothetical protein